MDGIGTKNKSMHSTATRLVQTTSFAPNAQNDAKARHVCQSYYFGLEVI
jgi:hypothetical protein